MEYITEALAVRGRGSNRKGKGDRERSKPRPGFRDLKKNQRAFCKEFGYWKVDCPKAKGKKKESKTARVVSTQASTSQADGSDSDSSVFSFSVTTPIIAYSGDTEWILVLAQRPITLVLMMINSCSYSLLIIL